MGLYARRHACAGGCPAARAPADWGSALVLVNRALHQGRVPRWRSLAAGVRTFHAGHRTDVKKRVPSRGITTRCREGLRFPARELWRPGRGGWARPAAGCCLVTSAE